MTFVLLSLFGCPFLSPLPNYSGKDLQHYAESKWQGHSPIQKAFHLVCMRACEGVCTRAFLCVCVSVCVSGVSECRSYRGQRGCWVYRSIISHVCPEAVSPLHWESANPSGLPIFTVPRAGFSVFLQNWVIAWLGI